MPTLTKNKRMIVILILHHVAGVTSNVHGESHHHHVHSHGNHGVHNHHEHGGSGDCELDDSLVELIKSFGLAILGKDQESADDVKPTEDHDHINIKTLIDELFHPSTTQKTTTTTTIRTTWTERLPIKSHDLGWDKSPVDLVMSNHFLEPVYGQDEKNKQLRKFEFTTQKPVYLTETHYYLPADFSDNHVKDFFSPIEKERATKYVDLNINLDVSQLIDKPTIPVVDTRLANFLLVNKGNRVNTKSTKPEEDNKHINEISDDTKILDTIDTKLLLQLKQPTTPPFHNKFKIAQKQNNSLSKLSWLQLLGSSLSRSESPGLVKKAITPISNRSHLSLTESSQLKNSLFQSKLATKSASIPISIKHKSQILHSALKQIKQDVHQHASRKSSIDVKLNIATLPPSTGKSNIFKQIRRGKQQSNNVPSSILHRTTGFSKQHFEGVKGMVRFNRLDTMEMKKDKLECKDRAEGLHADVSSGCQRFYMCHENGRSGRFTCPAGTLFSTTLGVCDWAAKVNCERFHPKG